MKNVKADIVIIGAGVIGCAIAYFLGKEGVKTLIVERDSIGSHASGCAPGLLYPLGGVAREFKDVMFPLTILGLQMHKELYPKLRAEAVIDYHFRQSSLLRLAFTDAEAQEFSEEADVLSKEGFNVYWLDRSEVLLRENRIASQVVGAACYQDMAEVDSYRYVLALAQAAETYGAEIRCGQLSGLKRKGPKLTAIELSSGEITCDIAVLAMGPWTNSVSASLGISIPIEPDKGQVLNIKASGHPFSSLLGWGDYYTSTTRHDGIIHYGATHEDAGFNEQPTTEGRDILISNLVESVPSLAEAQVALQTACIRPMTTDKLPIIGGVPGWEGVYLATGHWTKGILLSPVTARIVADLILKGYTSVPIAPFSPARFGSLYNE